ncbi:hypothetical protein CCP3SC1AL1_770017 [Gammaproteobacteria bacterium]
MRLYWTGGRDVEICWEGQLDNGGPGERFDG